MVKIEGKSKTWKESQEVALDVAISAVSAMAAKTLIAPVERLKLLFQTRASNVAVLANQSQQLQGIFPTIRYIVQTEGVLSFWRGHFATLLKYIPMQVLNFTFHAKLDRIFPKYDVTTNPYLDLASNLAKGSLAGMSSIAIVYPLDNIRTKMASDLGKSFAEREFSGFTDCVRKMYLRGGARSFYTAFQYSLFSAGLYRGFYFGLYQTAMKAADPKEGKIWYSLVFAQLSTNLAGFIVYPIDTVRRNLVVQAAKTEESRKLVSDKTFTACARRLYRERGIQGLYAGCLINVLRGAGGSLVLVFYNDLKGRAKRTNH